ncbi:hypothetical protein UFOVP29_295 [uncultured Caudovirales phage]|uniref:Uncharacterized protein n=1 Tax=uncultured Caudovirales phage TaxID=2100421 RepID=A0A6J5KPD8_9CAUD|nr:hypothetical protein UFOVP29_295 [uncultured Caudovirales phage]
MTPERPQHEEPINNIMTQQQPQPTDEQCSLFVYGSLTISDLTNGATLLKTQA